MTDPRTPQALALELELLRSYASGPRIWDAAAIFPEVMNLENQGLIEPVNDRGLYQLTDAGCQRLVQAFPGMQGSIPLPPKPDRRARPAPPDPKGDLDEVYGDLAAEYPKLDWDNGVGAVVSRALEAGFELGRSYEYGHPS